jgi:hypothetical protein
MWHFKMELTDLDQVRDQWQALQDRVMNVKDVNKAATSQTPQHISASYILVFHIKLSYTHGKHKSLAD